VKDCLHIWEFLRDILKEKNEDLVKWIDPTSGIFKIVKPDRVSYLWGFRKSQKGMKYANMARGIRHSRDTGFFDFINKDRGHGKKLVYKFSEKSKRNCEWLSQIMKD
jgi:hypothetical protein